MRSEKTGSQILNLSLDDTVAALLLQPGQHCVAAASVQAGEGHDGDLRISVQTRPVSPLSGPPESSVTVPGYRYAPRSPPSTTARPYSRSAQVEMRFNSVVPSKICWIRIALLYYKLAVS